MLATDVNSTSPTAPFATTAMGPLVLARPARDGVRVIESRSFKAIGAEPWMDAETVASYLRDLWSLTAIAGQKRVLVYEWQRQGGDKTPAGRGIARAEQMVRGHLACLAEPYPEAMRDAAALILDNTTRSASLSDIRPELIGYEGGMRDALESMGIDPKEAKTRARARRAEIETEYAEAFVRRLRDLAGRAEA